MMIPIWAIVATLVLVVALLAWAIVAAFAWWGLYAQLAEAEAEGRRLRIDVYDRRRPAPARRPGDRLTPAAACEGRELGPFRP